MTEELKTLKDLDCSNNSEYGCCYERTEESPHAVYTDDLRREVIKWIKQHSHPTKYHCYVCNKLVDEISICDDKGHFYNSSSHSAIIWIKHFFNIKESDLE